MEIQAMLIQVTNENDRYLTGKKNKRCRIFVASLLTAICLANPISTVAQESLTLDWERLRGGVTTSGNEIRYSGSPRGWSSYAQSVQLSSLDVDEDFELRFAVYASMESLSHSCSTCDSRKH